MNKQSVEQIIQAVGGKGNIAAATHCVTRLRLALKDESKVDEKDLEGQAWLIRYMTNWWK